MEKKKIEFDLPTLDDLFTSQKERDEMKLAKIREIPIDLIDDFPDHPYQVRDDEDMLQLIESVKERGVMVPALIRPKEDGRYVITLLDAGTEKVKVIKAYREATGLGLKECKDAVESAPCTVIEVTNKVDAELIAATFTEIGATVEIKEAE